ncbi:MAG: hypothetical protein PHG85_00105 [Candidatus Altiarchaeota archaeon]|nr:hypothetical protein [Candidatus Altiarchaeota archaeon]
MARIAGIDHTRFNTERKIHVKSELNKVRLDILKSLGFHEVRDPGFSQGNGTAFLVRNETGESDAHFILWNIIYDEIRKYTPKVEYNLTRLPDVTFGLDEGRWIAVEVEATRKSEKELMPKMVVLGNYADYFFVVTNWDNLEHYQEYGATFTRRTVQDKIASYFQGDSSLESKTKHGSSPDSTKS